MSKKILTERIALSLDCSRADALKIINTYQSLLYEQINDQGGIVIQGLGTFKVKSRNARQGRNPRTGEAIVIPARKIVSFKASAGLLRQLNQAQ